MRRRVPTSLYERLWDSEGGEEVERGGQQERKGDWRAVGDMSKAEVRAAVEGELSLKYNQKQVRKLWKLFLSHAAEIHGSGEEGNGYVEEQSTDRRKSEQGWEAWSKGTAYRGG